MRLTYKSKFDCNAMNHRPGVEELYERQHRPRTDQPLEPIDPLTTVEELGRDQREQYVYLK